MRHLNKMLQAQEEKEEIDMTPHAGCGFYIANFLHCNGLVR